ncbi:MAG: glycosyltransferase family 2 protein [Deltaproteobacteria bacterium]|nr:glycosyltransferase family 2 protein [Deltaproteobacteria bacterium]MBW2353437.1 glycosyltransferase family 2 protein [Deltaproteobacteria bacterium]
MPAVSVIIPVFNRPQKVMRAISSVLFQTFTDYEVVVVNDGSTDGTGDALRRFGDKVRLLTHSSNLGVSAARNTGIRSSHAPLVAFLDSDDYWLPDKLSVQTRFFMGNPQALICQTDEFWIRNGRRVNPKKRHAKPSGDVFEPSLRLCLISPSAVMLRRTLLDEVGLFDEDLPACEDYDLWLRIACRYPVYLIGEDLVVKEGGHPDQLSARYRGMDRFRIMALVKLISGGRLDRGRLMATLEELSVKCRIYGTGCIRRGRREEGESYLGLPQRLRKEYGMGE